MARFKSFATAMVASVFMTFSWAGQTLAATIPVTLDAIVNIGDVADGQWVSLNLLAGDYSVSILDGAWRFGDEPTSCNPSGEECGDGFQSNYQVRLADETILTGYGSPTTYETVAASLAEAQSSGPRFFTLLTNTTVYFGLPDRFGSGGDNSGGLSLEVTGPGLSVVPLPASALLLVAGVGGLAFLRRRQKS